MKELIKWDCHCLQVPKTEETNIFIDKMRAAGIKVHDKGTSWNVINNESCFIFENDFLDKLENLNDVIDKYSLKKFQGSKDSFYSEEEGEIKNIKTNAKDKEKYHKILDGNILNDKIRNLDISINELNEVLDNSKKSKLILDIFILFALSSKGVLKSRTYEFEIESNKSIYHETIDLDKSQPYNLYKLYDWIINDIEYKDSYTVKVEIVRKVIGQYKSLNNVDNMLNDAKLIYKRIVSKNTKDYFNMINTLKEDYLDIACKQAGNIRTFNISFMSWIGVMLLNAMKEINAYDGSDLLKAVLFSDGEKIGITLILAIIALVVIYICYYVEYYNLKKTYNDLKVIYKEKLLIGLNDFEQLELNNIIKEPKLGTFQSLIFAITMILLFIRWLFTFPW